MKDIAEFVPAPPPKWGERLARLGLTAKGIVYCLVGMLAFMVAFELRGTSEEQASQKGIFRFILEQPMGKILLGIVGAGLVFYVVWRFVQALRDSENKGKDAKRIDRRIGYLLSGAGLCRFAVYAFKLVLGEPTKDTDSRQALSTRIVVAAFRAMVGKGSGGRNGYSRNLSDLARVFRKV